MIRAPSYPQNGDPDETMTKAQEIYQTSRNPSLISGTGYFAGHIGKAP